MKQCHLVTNRMLLRHTRNGSPPQSDLRAVLFHHGIREAVPSRDMPQKYNYTAEDVLTISRWNELRKLLENDNALII